jgi:hypothetical protein
MWRTKAMLELLVDRGCPLAGDRRIHELGPRLIDALSAYMSETPILPEFSVRG